MALRITNHPLGFLLFSNFAVILAYVHQLTLLVVGPVANSMGKIDPAVLEAATDAGAGRWQIMRNVILPLSKTGIMLGLVLVFTQVMGDFFIIQQMSGGQSGSVVSELSTEIQAMQYPPAAASAMVLVLVVALFVGGAMRVVDVRKELAS
jgi:putative spermidine/putrescine transport system permease protein